MRTDIGVKVFGEDLDTIDRVCKSIEAALKPINGARDVIAAPIMGKGYLEITIDREAAARYGIAVEDIQNEIEVALGGRPAEAVDPYPPDHGGAVGMALTVQALEADLVPSDEGGLAGSEANLLTDRG